MAACALPWGNAEIGAAPGQGLQADFVGISSVLKKRKKSREVCSREGSQQRQRLAPGGRAQ